MSVTPTDAPLPQAAATAAGVTGLIVCMLALGAWAWSPPTVAMGVLLLAFVGARPLARTVYARVLRPQVGPGQLDVGDDTLRYTSEDGARWEVSRDRVAGLVAGPILAGVVGGRRLSVFLRGGATHELCLEGPDAEVDALLARIATVLDQPLQ